MPRKPRMFLPGVPCHVIQRGNNREATFFSEQDYLFYLECLSSAISRYGAKLHAYVLMTNHVHLLLSPSREDSISLAMQSIGRRYVQYINKEYRRSGTLFEGRYKSSMIDAENYLLACYRYIELNPVKACMVEHPGQYRWSSYASNALGDYNPPLNPHELYMRLGPDSTSRENAYSSLFSTDLGKDEIQRIRSAIQFSMPTGDSRFVEQIEAALGRKLGQAYRGRPRKSITT